MKNKILFGAMFLSLCTLSMRAYAQLEVKSTGDVKASQNLEVVNNSTVGNNLTVANDATVGNNQTISNNLTIGHDLTVNNNVTVNNVLEVSDTLTAGSYLNVVKSVDIAKNLNVSNKVQIAKCVAIGTASDTSAALKIEKIVPLPAGGNNTVPPYYGIKSHVSTTTGMPTRASYAVYGSASVNSSSISPTREMVGVCGYAYKSYNAPSTFAAGLVGMAHYYGGIGVYGAISMGIVPTTMGNNEKYAGYFSDTVKVSGTLIATDVSVTSDARFKEDIKEIAQEQIDNIHMLHPVSYKLKQDSAWQYDIDAKELQEIHYGLIAQDVQKIYPNLVYQRGEQLSINYIELIPLLIKTVQELSAEVEELKKNQSK